VTKKARYVFWCRERLRSSSLLGFGLSGDPETLNDQQKQMVLSPRKRKALAEIVFSDWGSSAL
jgi:hypothetical protein